MPHWNYTRCGCGEIVETKVIHIICNKCLQKQRDILNNHRFDLYNKNMLYLTDKAVEFYEQHHNNKMSYCDNFNEAYEKYTLLIKETIKQNLYKITDISWAKDISYDIMMLLYYNDPIQIRDNLSLQTLEDKKKEIDVYLKRFILIS